MSPKYSVIVAENIWDFFSLIWDFFPFFARPQPPVVIRIARTGLATIEAGFIRPSGNAAFFSLHKFKHLRISSKTNLPKCSGFFINDKPYSL